MTKKPPGPSWDAEPVTAEPGPGREALDRFPASGQRPGGWEKVPHHSAWGGLGLLDRTQQLPSLMGLREGRRGWPPLCLLVGSFPAPLTRSGGRASPGHHSSFQPAKGGLEAGPQAYMAQSLELCWPHCLSTCVQAPGSPSQTHSCRPLSLLMEKF